MTIEEIQNCTEHQIFDRKSLRIEAKADVEILSSEKTKKMCVI